ncbi:sensor histidine kinase [Streptomyces sp. NPDC014894]|uniref:sensor histidine kinase n=1 Tax=Streptomyces sp. NPDC014894 TaxID=3364931 RepID=UPI0036F9FF3E
MNSPWPVRAFDERYATVRAVLTALALAGDLLLLERPETPLDHALAVCGLLLCAVTVRHPPLALSAGSVLVVAGHHAGAGVVPALKALAAVFLFELALRHGGRTALRGAALLASAVVLNRLPDLPEQSLPVLYRAVVVAGLPLLLGSQVRGVRKAAERTRAEADLRARRAERDIAAARAAERTAFARELHDLVAHHVSSMVLRVGVARHVLPDAEPRVREVFDDLHTSGAAALADLRRLVAVLRAPDADGADPPPGGPRALRPELEAAAGRAALIGVRVETALDAGLDEIGTVRGLAVLRLVQEGLANTAKHAGAGPRARLSVRILDRGEVRLTLRDDGGARAPGRAPAASGLPGPAGHGLIGMRERVALLGGRMEAGPDGRGWRLRATLPATLERQEAVR